MQITPAEIAETLAMVNKEHLDIRTITLGLNLRGCTDSDIDTMARKVYDRMTTAAEQLVPTAEQLEREYGIPIVNKRISVTPIAEICAATDARDLSPIAVAMDKAAKVVGVDFVGGFSALVHKGASRADNNLMDSIPDALAATDFVCSSVNVGSTRAGINMDAAFKMAGIVKKTAEATADRQCIGAGKLVVFCNAVEDNPFMAGAFHGSGEADAVVNVGVSGPGVVRSVLANMPKDADMTAISEAIKATVFKITRAGELMAREASKRLGVTKGILDLSLAPTPAEGDSVAEILEASGACHAQRRSEEGRRHGIVERRWAFGRVHSRVGRRRHDPRSRGRRPFPREARGHDLRLQRGPRYDRHPRRHVGGNDLRHHRRRVRHRHDQQQDNRRARHPRHRQEGRRPTGVRRPSGIRPRHARERTRRHRLRPPRRPHARSDQQLEELAIRQIVSSHTVRLSEHVPTQWFSEQGFWKIW